MNNIKRVGVIGGGQLAWMMVGAAKALGVELGIQTPHPTDPAVAFAAFTIFAPVDDSAATAELATRCDAIAFENEFINLAALMPLQEQGVLFRPRLEALAPLLDKYDQRCYLRDLGLPVPKFVALEERGGVGAEEQRSRGAEEQRSRGAEENMQCPGPQSPIPFPVVLKVRRHGYDGQGTFIIKDREALETTLQRLGHTPVLLEEFIPFERELAVIAARSSGGEMAIYPVVETQQEEQVCRRVLVPAELDPAVTGQIEAIAHTLLNSLQAVGVFGIELFLTTAGKVLVNEIAPRTHNSGHFTLDACYTSQFEQHLRAVCDLPLGNPALKCSAAVMVNLLGYEYSHNDYLAKRQQLAQLPNSHVHWYGKSESRPGRKLGHVTVLLDGATKSELQAVAQTLESIWYGSRFVR